MTRRDFSALLLRIADGGLPHNDEERDIIMQVAAAIDKPMPKYACLACWLQRQADEVLKRFPHDQHPDSDRAMAAAWRRYIGVTRAVR